MSLFLENLFIRYFLIYHFILSSNIGQYRAGTQIFAYKSSANKCEPVRDVTHLLNSTYCIRIDSKMK